MALYIVVSLIDSKKHLVIPSNWIFGLNDVKVFNGCVLKYQTRLIFFSQDIRKIANFELPVQRVFMQDGDACYKAKILKSFGKDSQYTFMFKKN